ncbi:MAG: hypothetical protein ACHQ0J_10430 [Candidatus Dormibacterales bacterium]
MIPAPSDEALLRLARIAGHARGLLAAEQPHAKNPVGLANLQNERRRAVEAIWVLLADAEVRAYLEELEQLGLLEVKR